MILVDTSVWIGHFRAIDRALEELLDRGEVLMHPFVLGELALGYLDDRTTILSALRELPQAAFATDEEVIRLIEANALFGLGIGYVDAHLLTAVRLTPGAGFWTNDKRLAAAHDRLRIIN